MIMTIIVSMIRNYSSQIPDHSSADKAVFELQADICQTLANPKRLQIVHLLKNGELPVSAIVKAMGIPKANVSQHLSIMRQKGLIISRREGTSIYYRLVSQKITEACSLMREVLLTLLAGQETLSKSIRADRGDNQ
jgi:ArsR family transcriptional regulator, virulence genes transcriptional regulator